MGVAGPDNSCPPVLQQHTSRARTTFLKVLDIASCKKAIAEVPNLYKKELQQLREKLNKATLEIAPDPLGIARREQEEISKLANWAGYHSRPAVMSHDILHSPCTIYI